MPAKDIKDASYEYIARYQFIPVEGTNDVFDLVQIKGNIAQEGTPINKSLLQPHENHIYQENNPHKTTLEQVLEASGGDGGAGGIVPVSAGGTGTNTFIKGGILLGNNNSILSTLAGTGALYSDISGNPKFGTLPLSCGGLGATTTSAARDTLGASNGVWPISLGGTGATSAASALDNLGAFKPREMTLNITISGFSPEITAEASLYCLGRIAYLRANLALNISGGTTGTSDPIVAKFPISESGFQGFVFPFFLMIDPGDLSVNSSLLNQGLTWVGFEVDSTQMRLVGFKPKTSGQSIAEKISIKGTDLLTNSWSTLFVRGIVALVSS